MRPSRMPLLAGLVVLASCDGLFGPDIGPPSDLTRSTLPSTLVVGQTIDSVRLTVKDKSGKAIRGVTVQWVPETGSVSPTSSVTDRNGVAATSWTLATTVGQQTLTARVEGLDPVTFAGHAGPATIQGVTSDIEQVSLHAISDTVIITAQGEDEYGNETGNVITWTSSAPSVATVAGGMVVSRDNGTAEIVAAAAGFSDTTTVMVEQVMAALDVSGPHSVLAVGEVWPFVGAPVDSNGFSMAGQVVVTWTSSNPSVVAVDDDGTVTAAAVGTAQLTATADPLVGTLELEVVSGPRPAITSVSPETMLAGDTIIITGTGFGGTPAGNVVVVADVPATVLTASGTQLTAELAAPDAYPCGPRAARRVAVTVDRLEAAVDQVMALAPRTTLAVGESAALTGAEADCFELTEQGSYAVSVFSALNSPTARTSFLLRGTGATTATAAPGTIAAAAPRVVIRSPARAPDVQHRPEEVAHLRLLEENIRLAEELSRSSGRNLLPRAVAAEPVPTAGELRSFRIPDLDADFCDDYQTVTARAVHVGQRSVVWEDTLAPLAGQVDALWETLGQEFDTHMYPVLLDNFGDPLIYDAQLDDNDRFFMLFSSAINDLERNVAGFVFSGDMVPRLDCASSDFAEIFYGMVPTVSGSGFDGNTTAAWHRTMRSTVIHEVKHITSFAHRFHNNATRFEENWLEEATARLAEELYARPIFGYGQNDNTGYARSVYCEVRPTFEQCEGKPWVMGKHFLGLMDYYANIERLSPLGQASNDDFSYYGSGWLFVRWAIDQSSLTEPDFVKALIAETSLGGIDNISARTGRELREMLADFSLAIAIDDDPSGVVPADPALGFPTWHVRNIYAGLHEDFPDDFVPFPLHERTVGFGNFDVEVESLRGGTASIFRLTGTIQGSQLLELLSTSGGAAPSGLGLAVVRVE